MEHRLVARSGRVAVVVQAALLFVVLPALFAAGVIGPASAIARVASGAGMATSLAAGWWLTRGGFGPAPTVAVDPGGFTIVHPRLLDAPFRIDRTNVLSVRICRNAPGLPFTANVQRFPWDHGPGTATGRGWAFDFKNGSLFPTLTATAAAPTVLVVLRDPVRIPMRRWLPRSLIRLGLRLPRREAVAGIMLCVRNPERLEPAVGTWGEPGQGRLRILAS